MGFVAPPWNFFPPLYGLPCHFVDSLLICGFLRPPLHGSRATLYVGFSSFLWVDLLLVDLISLFLCSVLSFVFLSCYFVVVVMWLFVVGVVVVAVAVVCCRWWF